MMIATIKTHHIFKGITQKTMQHTFLKLLSLKENHGHIGKFYGTFY